MDEKIEVATCDEGEESNYIAPNFENPLPEDTNPEVYDHTGEDLELVLQLLQQSQNYDASSSQRPLYNQQGAQKQIFFNQKKNSVPKPNPVHKISNF